MQAFIGIQFIYQAYFMKLMPFTNEVCQELIKMGYNHFVIYNEHDKDELRNPEAILTLEPVRNLPQNKAIPIKQMMTLPVDKTQKVYVVFKD